MDEKKENMTQPSVSNAPVNRYESAMAWREVDDYFTRVLTPRVDGVRAVARDIAAHPDLDATAIQTVGVKGWDGLIIARRR